MSERRVVIDSEVGMIYFQFSFSASSAVPYPLRRLEDETQDGHVTRKAVVWNSVQLLEPTDRISFKGLLAQLEREFTLVDGCFQRRYRKDGGMYSMVRYVFARKNQAIVNGDFAKIAGRARINLIRLLSDAFWRIRAYRNEVERGVMLSLNFEHRLPVVDRNGRTITEWRKDPSGKRVGDNPTPIEPNYLAFVRGKEIVLRQS